MDLYNSNHQAITPVTSVSDDDESKLNWLQSQLIGADATIATPFGTRRLTYADHTASGRPLRHIEEFLLHKVLPLYGNTHTDDSHVGAAMSAMSHDASSYIKKCMGAGPDDALLFCGSGTTAAIKRLQEVIGVAATAVVRRKVDLEEEERWVVFVGPYEHHSNLLTWRESLAEVVEIGSDLEGLIDLEELASQLGSVRYQRRPKLGSFSACSNVTGIYTDTRALARLLHRHGAYACFDFAASGPYEKIRMRSGEMDGYDAVFLSTHKFVGGPGTPGILLMNKALYLLRSTPPSTSGGGTVSYVNGYNSKDTLYYEDVEEREDAGTPPITQKIRASLAFWVKSYIGHTLIHHRERLHTSTTLRRLLGNPRIRVLGNTTVPRQPIISFLIFPDITSTAASIDLTMHKPLHGRFVARLLNDLFGIQARGGCSCAGPYGHLLLGIDEVLSLALRGEIAKGYEGMKPGWTRGSFPYYMSSEEMEFLLRAVELVAEEGHRFLNFYDFDWKSGRWSFESGRAMEYNVAALLEAEMAVVGRAAKGGCPFGGYLEEARRVARLLSEVETRRGSVPEDINPDLVLFKV